MSKIAIQFDASDLGETVDNIDSVQVGSEVFGSDLLTELREEYGDHITFVIPAVNLIARGLPDGHHEVIVKAGNTEHQLPSINKTGPSISEAI